jgi:glycosyltransferase involved in cell wall biosynthesis
MYYERPNMVRFALDSIAAQNYDNYEVAIIDDGSTRPIMPIAQYYPFIDKTIFFNTGDTVEKKLERGGSVFGQKVNQAIEESSADLGIMLCDDDALTPTYLEGLNTFYSEHPKLKYSYGHVLTYDPFNAVRYPSIKGNYVTPLNYYDQPIDPYCKVDASQVSWRLKDFLRDGIRFPYPQTSALDAEVYRQMYNTWGPCRFNGLVTQYKGVFSDQMGNRSDLYSVIDSSPQPNGMVK